MPVIINELEVIAPPPNKDKTLNDSAMNIKPPGPTPEDLYWATRKLLERKVRLQAR